MLQKSLYLVVVSDEEECDRFLVPLEEDADGQIRPEFPDIAAEFFETESCWNLAYIHGHHE